MLTPHDLLRPNEADVAAKVLEGEAIIINLSPGALRARVACLI